MLTVLKPSTFCRANYRAWFTIMLAFALASAVVIGQSRVWANEPPGSDTRPAQRTFVLIGELVGQTVTETFEFHRNHVPLIELEPTLAITYPLADDHCLRLSEHKSGTIVLEEIRLRESDDRLLTQLDQGTRARRPALDHWRQAGRPLSVEQLQHYREEVRSETYEHSGALGDHGRELFRDHSEVFSFFDALRVFRQLPGFRIQRCHGGE